MKRGTISIDDTWVLSRAGHFSHSFSDFLMQLAPTLPEKQRKGVEKAAKILGPHGVDELGIPPWAKPFASTVLKEVSKEVYTELAKDKDLAKVAGDLFGAGVFSLSNALYEVAKERGITNEGFLHLIQMLPEFEALMYFMNVRKFYRDHCAHQLRVAVLGDFLLGLKSQAGGIEGIIKDKLNLSSEEVKTAWWFAGLLHDTGIPLAELTSAVNWSLLNEILRCYPSMDVEVSPMSVNLASNKVENGKYLSILTDGMPSTWQGLVKEGLGSPEYANETTLFKAGSYVGQEYQPRKSHINHGVVAAVNLLRTLGPPERLKKNLPEDRPLIEAAKAISIHNLKGDLGRVLFEDYPLAFLLILADELQEWSRPVPVPVKDTYFTTNMEKVALLDAIYYADSNVSWDLPYINEQAKRLTNFDFKRLCKDKADILKALDCAEEFPETEVKLRDIRTQKHEREETFSIKIGTK
jgi:hypothetical protein